MKLKFLSFVIAFVIATPALSQITTVQAAHEVALSSVRLPASESGTLAFKACKQCQTQSARVDGDTRWLVNNKSVSLKDFRSAVEKMANRNKDYITVRHHLERDLITRVSIIVR